MFATVVMDVSSINLATDQRRQAPRFGGIHLLTASAGEHNNVVQVRFPRARCHIWVEFVYIRTLRRDVFLGYSVSFLSSKTNILKFQFNLESVPML